MLIQPVRLRVLALVAALALLACASEALADPPSRVARLGYVAGAVSFSPAGESDWVRANLNRPLTRGDRLWVEPGSRAEVQLGAGVIRLSAATGLAVLDLDDRSTQLQLSQGVLNVHLRRLEPDQVFEVDTPNLAFALRQPGDYRIEVDAAADATTLIVRRGQGEAYGEGAAYVIDSRQPYRFTGTGLRDYQTVDASRADDFDRWAGDRDRAYDNALSARYVSPEVIGYQDLDANGRWRADRTYGNVWIPTRVAADWAPYRDGHWAWVDPWGWTWIDDAPWGFAVSHFGRWANLGGTWAWVPGPVQAQAYYAPALVVFVGGASLQLAMSGRQVGGVAWFPLGPREVYRPAYAVSRGYFENVNRSNTVINNTVINNTYNNTQVTNIEYVNRQVPGAVVAVPTTAFMQSQPVARVAQRVGRDLMVGAAVTLAAPVAPTPASVRGAAAQGGKPPARLFERAVVARTAPPANLVGLAAQQLQLNAKPGQPLDDASRRNLTPRPGVPAPAVKVVTPAREAPRTLPPPASTGGQSAADAQRRPEPRNAAEAAAGSGPPRVQDAPAQGGGPMRAAPARPALQPAPQRAMPEPARTPVAAPPLQAPVPQPQQQPQPATVTAPTRTAPPNALPPVPTSPVTQPRPNADLPRDPSGSPPSRPAPRAADPVVLKPPQIAPAPAPAMPAPAPPVQRLMPPRPTPAARPDLVPPPQPVQAGRPSQQVLPVPPSNPERPPTARPAEARPQVADPRQPAPQPAARVPTAGPEPRPAASRPQDRRGDGEEPPREPERRKP